MALGLPTSFSNTGKATGSGSGKTTGSAPPKPVEPGLAAYWQNTSNPVQPKRLDGTELDSKSRSFRETTDWQGKTPDWYQSVDLDKVEAVNTRNAFENYVLRAAKPQFDLMETGDDLFRTDFRRTRNNARWQKSHERGNAALNDQINAIDVAAQELSKAAAAGDINAINQLRGLMEQRHGLTMAGFKDDRKENRQNKKYGLWQNNANATSAAAFFGEGRRTREREIYQGFRHAKRDIGRSEGLERNALAEGHIGFDRQIAANEQTMTAADYMIQKLGLDKQQADRVLDKYIHDANLSVEEAEAVREHGLHESEVARWVIGAQTAQTARAQDPNNERSAADWDAEMVYQPTQIKANEPSLKKTAWRTKKAGIWGM